MNETELERLVARLVGDTSQYIEALQSAVSATEGAADSMRNDLSGVEDSMTEMASGAGDAAGEAADELKEMGGAAEDSRHRMEDLGTSTNNLTTALSAGLMPAFARFHTTILAVTSAYVALRGLMSIIHDFEAQEKAERDLSVVLRANERDVSSLMDRYKEFATEMQNTTTMADEVALGLVKTAESFDLTGSKAEAAVRDATALAEINNTSAQAMIRLTAAVAAGDIQRAMMFSRMVPQLRGVRNEMEFMERYTKLVVAGEDAMAEAAGTASGQFQKLGNDLSDLSEGLGEAVASGLLPMIRAFRDVVKGLQTMDKQTRDNIVNVTAFVVGLEALALLLPRVTTALMALAANPLFWVAAAAVALSKMVAEMQRTTEEAEKMRQKLDEIGLQAKIFREAIAEETAKNLGRLDMEELEKRKAMLQQQLDAQRNTQREVESMYENSLSKLGAGFNAGNKAVAGIARTFGVTSDEIEKLRTQTAEEVETTEALERAVRQVEAAMRRVAEQAPKGFLPVQEMMFGMLREFQQFATGQQRTPFQILTEQMNQFKQTAAEYQKALSQEAARIHEQVKTPEERLADRLILLDELLMNNELGWEDYERAVAAAKDQLISTARALDEVAGRQAALAGTAEARGRIEEFLSGTGGFGRGWSADEQRRAENNRIQEALARRNWAQQDEWVRKQQQADPAVRVLNEILDTLRGLPGAKFSIARIG